MNKRIISARAFLIHEKARNLEEVKVIGATDVAAARYLENLGSGRFIPSANYKDNAPSGVYTLKGDE